MVEPWPCVLTLRLRQKKDIDIYLEDVDCLASMCGHVSIEKYRCSYCRVSILECKLLQRLLLFNSLREAVFVIIKCNPLYKAIYALEF